MPVDNFVHPKFRGGMRGVQKAMFQYPDRRSRGPFGFGFPNDAHRIIGLRMLKYLDLGKMPVLFKRLNSRRAVQNRMSWMPSIFLKLIQSASSFAFRISIKASKFQTASAVRTRIVDSFDSRFDTLWERARKGHNVLCVRDERYLKWRYGKPGASYRIVIAERGNDLVGYAVTGVKHDSGAVAGYIADLFNDDSPGVDAALVKCAVLELLSRKADYASCWMLPDKRIFQALREFGFARKDDMFPSVNIVFQYFDPQTVDEGVLKDPKNWYLTMGDSDVF